MNDISNKIKKLKKDIDAIILAHNYQYPEIQDIADFVGDSLALAMKAKNTDARVIVFCGVDFMAETAKIVNPTKIVIHPDRDAICPMAAMVDIESLEALKKDHPDAAVVSYVNTTAEVKTITDICCTSSNAIKVVRSIPQKEIIFVPDTNLGLYIKRFIKDKEIILWPGCCPTHHKISVNEITDLKKQYPEAEILVHPECQSEIIDIADYVYSTEGMVNHVKRSTKNTFIIGTEKELCYRLKKENPDKNFYHPHAICPTMKKITIEKVLKGMESMSPTVDMPKSVIDKALTPIEKMLKIGRDK